jgi:hypothetical protein
MYIISALALFSVSLWLIRVKSKRSFTKLITNKEKLSFQDAVSLDESRI